MDIVNEVLEKAAKEEESFKPITVNKHLALDFDLGTLLAVDTNDLDLNSLRSKKDDYLKDLARDNTQLLINKIWKLPAERLEETIVVRLPHPSSILPREKPIPKPKPLTKWQEFAKEKGIKKKKKDRLMWDDTLKKWVPRWGYKKVVAEKEKDWVIEAPGNADPAEDPFAKKKAAKKERIAKNELQRLRNLAKAKKVKVPRFGLLTSDQLSSKQLRMAAAVSKVSTASLGKFQPKAHKEKGLSNLGALLPMAKKRKAAPLSLAEEKKTSMTVIEGILKKKPKLDIEKAVNREIFHEQQQRSEEKKNGPKSKKSRDGGRGGGKKRGKGKKGQGQGKVGKKPKGGGGARKSSKGGRKRR